MQQQEVYTQLIHNSQGQLLYNMWVNCGLTVGQSDSSHIVVYDIFDMPVTLSEKAPF